MRFHAEQRFTVPADRVLALFTDADFYPSLRGLPSIGAPEILEHSTSGDTVRISLRQRYTGDLPAAALAFIDPGRLTWVEELVFDLERRRASTRLLPDHYPDRLTCQGIYVFTDLGGGGSTRRLEGDLKVRAPLVGGRVEQALVSGLQEHAAAEQDLIEERLVTPGDDAKGATSSSGKKTSSGKKKSSGKKASSGKKTSSDKKSSGKKTSPGA